MTQKTFTRRQLVATVASAAVASPFLKAAATAEPGKTMRGVFPIMATPFTATKAVDWEDLAHEVEFLDRCNVPGMVWPQLASENSKLTKEERLRGMEVIAKAGKGKKPAIILGVQGANSKEAMEYLEHAEKLDPDGLIALPPTQAKTIDEWREYYHTLARATKRPLFIQNSLSGTKLVPSIEVLVELAREYPNCAYFKEEIKPEIERQLELAKHRPVVKRVFAGGGGRNLLYVLRLGLDGVMAGNAYADVCVDIWNLYSEGQKEKAREIYSKLLLVLACEPQIDGTRQYMMKRRGVFKTMVSRQKDISISPEEAKELEFNFDSLKSHLRV